MAFSYSIDHITELEDEIKTASSNLSQKWRENTLLHQEKRADGKMINEIGLNGEFDNKVGQLSSELWCLKEERRKVYYDKLAKEKVMIDRHE